MPGWLARVLDFGFVAMLYVILGAIVMSIRSHLITREVASGVVLQFTSGPEEGRRFSVDRPLVVGRSREADVVILDDFVSDFHARFALSDGRVTLQDLGSTNGTFVNGERVKTRVAIMPGDDIVIGGIGLEVR